METVKVYAFKYFDWQAKSMRLASDMATAWAIRDIRAELLPETAREVKATLVGHCGLLMAAPREVEDARQQSKH
jgi:hypothetical protein